MNFGWTVLALIPFLKTTFNRAQLFVPLLICVASLPILFSSILRDLQSATQLWFHWNKSYPCSLASSLR